MHTKPWVAKQLSAADWRLVIICQQYCLIADPWCGPRRKLCFVIVILIALERQYLSCTYLAHHELERVFLNYCYCYYYIVIIIIVIIIIVIIITIIIIVIVTSIY